MNTCVQISARPCVFVIVGIYVEVELLGRTV